MTDETRRRRVLACVGAGITVGLAGCSDDGGEPTEDGEPGDDDETATETDEPTEEPTEISEPTEEPSDGTTADGAKPLRLNLLGTTDYQTERVTVESLTFVGASADDESRTIEVGDTADISDGDLSNPVSFGDGLAVPYGTYESVEMTLTPVEVVDGEGSSVDVSAGTVSISLSGRVEESVFKTRLSLYLTVRNGQYAVTGYTASL